MCATVYYRKSKGGRLYPKAARTGPYAYAQEVTRVNGKVATKYIGIVKVLESQEMAERRGGETDDDPAEQHPSLQ
ncbi:MAG: hypothetical protein JRN73_09810 [Nitrososphaerota archaeon]|nr:hypothetical protein [Nitrososphaerota archaeon]